MLPQPGHTKPSGQRAANRYLTQAAHPESAAGTQSTSEESWSSASPKAIMFAIRSITNRRPLLQHFVVPDAEG